MSLHLRLPNAAPRPPMNLKVNSGVEHTSGGERVSSELRAAGRPLANERKAPRYAPKKRRHNVIYHTWKWLDLFSGLALVALCIVPQVSCIRIHAASSLVDTRSAADVKLGASGKERAEQAARLLMQKQLAQFERQQMLEAAATPFPAGVMDRRLSSPLQGLTQTQMEAEGQTDAPSLVDLGSALMGVPEVLRAADDKEAADVQPQVPYSFMNWGQIGGMMQSPILAHTGIPVQIPRQVVGTTVGLDFDSPATFHGPLLVVLMVSILLFFLVLILCCWMMKAKNKHDRFMAEKIRH